MRYVKRYKASRDVDEQDRAEARRLKRESGFRTLNEHKGGWIASMIIAIIPLGISGLIMDQHDVSGTDFLISVSLFALGIYIGIKGFKSSVGAEVIKKDYEVFKQWMWWKYLRELQYYGDQIAEWHIYGGKIFQTILEPDKSSTFATLLKTDIWDCKEYNSVYLNPEKYVVAMPNGKYDYTKYFEEMAYIHMVTMYRHTSHASMINWVEATAWYVFEDGMPLAIAKSAFSYENVDSSRKRKQRLPFAKYPINPAQQEEICSFDYVAYEETGHQWIKGVWNNASKKFQEEKQKHVDANALESDDVNRIRKIDAYAKVKRRETDAMFPQLLKAAEQNMIRKFEQA